MTVAANQDAILHQNGQAISQKALHGFCTRHNVIQLSPLPSRLSSFGRPEEGQRMLVKFAPMKKPGIYAYVYMAIELTHMVGQRVDLVTDGSPVAAVEPPAGK